MRGYFNLQAKKKERVLRMDRSAPQISPKTNYRMCLTLGVTAGCLFLPPKGRAINGQVRSERSYGDEANQDGSSK